MTLGVAVIGAISGGAITGAIGRGFASQTHAGWWIITGLSVLILALGLLTTGTWARRTARRAAEAFPDLQPPSAYRQRTPARPVLTARAPSFAISVRYAANDGLAV